MDKKFIASVIVCVMALTMVATGTYYIGQKNEENVISFKKAEEATVAPEEDIAAAQNALGEETTTPADRVSDVDETASSYEGESKVVGSMTIVEKNTESNASEEEALYGLSSEAAAVVNSLEFSTDSKMEWPVQGNVILEYNMDNTIYFPTLDVYKCNPAVAIQSSEGSEVVAAAKGVVMELSQNEEYGVYMKVALGNDYVATYGQIINPQYEVGETVEAGDVIAYINKPTSYYSKEGDNLYFQLTKEDIPVDPIDFMDYED